MNPVLIDDALDRLASAPAFISDWDDVLTRASDRRVGDPGSGFATASGDARNATRRAEAGTAPKQPDAVEGSLRSRSPRPRLLALAILIAASASVALAITTPWSVGPTLLDRAEAALTLKPGTILYTRFVAVQTNRRTGAITRRVTEVWRTSDGSFRAFVRYRQNASREEVGGIWYSNGFIRSPGPTLTYDPATNTIEATTRFAFGDPAEGIRKDLTAGTLRMTGTTSTGGRALERLQGADASETAVILVDSRTGDPVEATFRFRNGIERTVQIRFQAYEYLTATQQNLRLTNLAAEHPRAKVKPGSCLPQYLVINGKPICR